MLAWGYFFEQAHHEKKQTHFIALKIEEAEEVLRFIFRVKRNKEPKIGIFSGKCCYCNYQAQYAHKSKMTWDGTTVEVVLLRNHY